MTAAPARIRDGHLVTALALLFLLPSLVFSSYLALAPRLVVLAGLAGACVLVVRRAPPVAGSLLGLPLAWGRLGACAALAIVLLLLGGEGHVFFANSDWLWRDAVLADVGRTSSLPTYAYDGGVYWLRAPLGMYLVPGLVARWAGLSAGHVALLAQNAVLLAGLFYVLMALATRRGFVVLAVFVAFSGLDILGTLVMAKHGNLASVLAAIPSQIEVWIASLQYSSDVTLLFWVPNHCLPGWWLALLALLCARGEIGVGETGIGLAASLLWAPLPVIGAVPILCVLFAMRLRPSLGDFRFWASATAALCFLPIAVYIVADSAKVPFHARFDDVDYWLVVAIFLVFEIPQVFVLWAAWRRLRPEIVPILIVAIVTLVVLPAVQFGPSNDLLMRGSIPALAILAFAFGEIVAEGWRPRPVVFVAAMAMVVIGAVSPAFEIARALLFPRFAVSDCTLVSVWRQQLPNLWPSNYFAARDRLPNWLMAPSPAAPLTSQTAACWPDHPFDPTMGVYARTNAELRASWRARQGASTIK